MGKSKKRKAASKPVADVAMKAAVRQCAHAQCEPTECLAGRRPKVRREDLPNRAFWASVDVEEALELLASFTDEALVVVERRAGVVVGRPEEGAGSRLADGYPTSLRSGPGTRGRAERLCDEEVLVSGVEVRCGARRPCEKHPRPDDDLVEVPPPEYSDPSGELAAALADTPEWIQRDGLTKAVKRFYRQLKRATSHLVLAEAMLADLKRSPLAGRASSVGVCRACDRTVPGVEGDRLRDGYCNACRMAWQRRCQAVDGPVDREAFEAERLARRKREAA